MQEDPGGEGGFNVYEFYSYLNSKGVKIRLDAGEPDIPVHEGIVEALRREAHNMGYTDSSGLPELRDRIAEMHGVERGEVAITPGSKHAIAALIHAFREGATLIAPYWAGYRVIASVFKRRIHVYRAELESGWMPGEIRGGRGLLVMNYPNNPTGAVLPGSKAREMLDQASDNKLAVLSDEAYRDIVFSGERFVAIDYRMEDTVSVYSFSKTFSAPGLRLAYAVGDKSLIRKVIEFNQATITSVPIYVQKAALIALDMLEEASARARHVYHRRARVFGEALRGSCLRYVRPEGAFYYFIRAPGADGTRLAYRLAESGLGVFPGSAFGGSWFKDFIRVSLTAPERVLVEAASIIRREACGE